MSDITPSEMIGWLKAQNKYGTRLFAFTGDGKARSLRPPCYMINCICSYVQSHEVATIAKSATVQDHVQRLQTALARWLPSIKGDGTKRDEQAAEDAYLLAGSEFDPEICYGDSGK